MRLGRGLDDEIRGLDERVDIQEGRARLERGQKRLRPVPGARGRAGEREARQSGVDRAAHLPADRAEAGDADLDRAVRGSHRGAWYHAPS